MPPSNTENTEEVLELLPEELEGYPSNVGIEEQRRAFIFEMLAPLEYAASEKMAEAPLWEAYLKDGTLPPGNIRRVK